MCTWMQYPKCGGCTDHLQAHGSQFWRLAFSCQSFQSSLHNVGDVLRERRGILQYRHTK